MYDVYARPGVSYLSGLFFLLVFVVAGLFFGSLVSLGLWALLTGQPILSMTNEMLNPKFAGAIRILQLVSTFFIFFIPAVITARILSRKPFRFLGFNMYFSLRQLGMVILIMGVALPLVGALSEINKIVPVPASWEVTFRKLEETYEKQVKVLAHITGWGEYVISMIIMALAPAIFEETLFRGGLQNILQKLSRNPWISIGFTSIVFSLIHFSYYGFLPRVALGVILGLIFYYSQSIWLSIFAHFFNNAIVVTEMFYLSRKGKPVEEAMNDTFPVWWGIIAMAALLIFFRFFRKFAERDILAKKPAEDIALDEKWIT
jgi:membrane protease YdiL (CAAX protease family)